MERFKVMFGQIGLFEQLLVALVLSFLLSMIILIIFQLKQKHNFSEISKKIEDGEYVKVRTKLLNSKGGITVLSVDGEPPFFSNDVLEQAFYVLPGSHTVVFKVKRKLNFSQGGVTPYYDYWGPFSAEFQVSKNDIISLCVDGITQEIFMKKIEEE
ncbi:MAG: hypothetical protein ACRDA4_06575 [Filifactoraceae bacterium]